MLNVKCFFVLTVLLIAPQAFAKSGNVNSAGNFTVGMGPSGAIFMTDRHPELDPGLGAHVYFDYRWSPDISTTTTVEMMVQDGTDTDQGQTSIVYIAIPSVDVKYYWVTNPSRWDPYVSAGIGYYVLTHGSRGRGVSSGIGAQIGIGFDYYLTTRFSFGVDSQLRSVALLGGGGTGNFPLAFRGNLGFHF
ncbi:MAG: OmpW family outer membrane protein [Deltaproteobacteria bacterium]|nr:OmpW family outer membrane protein [Deltaproteobacteria bacterium]